MRREREDHFKAGTCFKCGELGHKKMDCPSAGAAPSRSDQRIKPDKPKPWAKPGANDKRGTSDAADQVKYGKREKRVIAAVAAAMVEQRGKPASEAKAVATEALATILGKTKDSNQGKPREVGDAGRAARAKQSKAEQAKQSKAEQAYNHKKTLATSSARAARGLFLCKLVSAIGVIRATCCRTRRQLGCSSQRRRAR